MPYKIEGSDVLHFKDGKWTIKQHCSSKENAEAAVRLLRAKEHNPDFKVKNGR